MKRITFLDIIMIFLFLLSVYLVLTRIFGHSATDFNITVTLFSSLGILIYRLNREVGELNVKMNYVQKDISMIKNKLIKDNQ